MLATLCQPSRRAWRCVGLGTLRQTYQCAASAVSGARRLLFTFAAVDTDVKLRGRSDQNGGEPDSDGQGER
jgi:hypothetical protein